MNWILKNGSIENDDGVRGDVFVIDGVLADRAAPDARTFDASDLIVAPGICDVHGDGFERNLAPRPGVVFSLDTAILETDRQLIANGITTAWLAMTVSWEPGLRRPEMAVSIVEALDRLRPQLACDFRLQIRWEIYALDAVDCIAQWLEKDPKPVLALNDHLTGMLEGDRMRRKLPEYAAKAGLTPDTYMELVERTAARRSEIPAAMERLLQTAQRAGVTVFAHDEPDAATRRANREIGVSVSEFPLSTDAAGNAVQHEEPVILGAPNVLRGGSHVGAMGAADAIRDGLCTVLASDYYYPSQMQAVPRLIHDGAADFGTAWDLISRNAALAGGLSDRGALTPGARGDLVAVKRTETGLSTVATFVNGRLVWLCDAARLAA